MSPHSYLWFPDESMSSGIALPYQNRKMSYYSGHEVKNLSPVLVPHQFYLRPFRAYATWNKPALVASHTPVVPWATPSTELIPSAILSCLFGVPLPHCTVKSTRAEDPKVLTTSGSHLKHRAWLKIRLHKYFWKNRWKTQWTRLETGISSICPV